MGVDRPSYLFSVATAFSATIASRGCSDFVVRADSFAGMFLLIIVRGSQGASTLWRNSSMGSCRKFGYWLCVLGVVSATIAPAFGQGNDAGGAEPVSLTTSDGVQLRLTYIPGSARKGTDQAKQTTPVVMLHDFKSTRTVFMPLAAQLAAAGQGGAQSPSFAVILVDMRAHGESTKQISPQGGVADLDAAKLSKEGLYAMASLDMEAVRNFLVEKNDDAELNLNKLCIVGSGLGAGVAANWALQDWSAPPLAVGKQGQDVKAIVMISPRWSYNGLTMEDAMKSLLLKKNVAWMLIYGAQDQKLKPDFQRIEKQIERVHPELKKTGGQGTRGFEVSPLASSLQGDSLLSKSGDVVNGQIVKFLTENVAALKLPWTNRTKKLP